MAVKGPKKFTAVELQELQNLQEEINTLSYQFGQLQISKIKIREVLCLQTMHRKKEQQKEYLN